MPGKLYAVIDTNVLVSALISKNQDAPPFVVLANVFRGSIIPVFNDEILAEYRDVLSRNQKFHINPELIEVSLRVFEEYGLALERTTVEGESFPDPKDIVFYEVKMSKDDAYLVTGNTRHFPKKPFVLTPKEMVELLSSLE